MAEPVRLAFKVFVGGQLVGLAGAAGLFAAGHRDAAWIVGNVGSLAWMLGHLVWIAVWDSRKRWPDTTTLGRLGRLVTFQR